MSSRLTSDAGETLLEIVIAVMILGIGSVSLLPAVGTSVNATRLHRQQSVAGRVLDNFAEYMKNQAYVPCATSAVTAYGGYRTGFLTLVGDPAPTNRLYEPTISTYSVTVSVEAGTPVSPAVAGADSVTFGDCTAGSTPYDTAAGDDRVQRLTLSVLRPDGSAGAKVQMTRWKST